MSSGTLAAATDGRRTRTDRTATDRAAIERAIIQAVAYADVFDYPLTADEIHRYLVGVSASRGTVRNVLNDVSPERVGRSGRFYHLTGREASVEVRRTRSATASEYWQRALGYGRSLGNLPFVRMVAVTGALAMDNIADGDIDYLVVTEPGRLWLCRALVVGLVKAAALRGTVLCPNYFLSDRAMVLDEHNLFTAHEVTQMVPLSGMDTYRRMRELNQWTFNYLPNASGSPKKLTPIDARPGRGRRLVEGTLRSRLGSPIERWEMGRKMTKLGKRGDGHTEAAFGPDWCKGHFGDHGQQTLARYAERLRVLEPQLR